MSFLYYFHLAITNHLSIAMSMSPEWMVASRRLNCISIGYLDFVDMHQWFLVSWKDIKVRCDDIDVIFIVHVLEGRTLRKHDIHSCKNDNF